MQRESHTRSVVTMTRDQMEQLRFRGRARAVVLPGTQLAPTHTHSHMCQLTAGRLVQQQHQEQNWKNFRSIRTFLQALTSFQSPSSHPAFGVGMPMELVSEIGRRFSEVSHELRSTSFLRQWHAVAFQRGNASCIFGILQIDHDVKWLSLLPLTSMLLNDIFHHYDVHNNNNNNNTFI